MEEQERTINHKCVLGVSGPSPMLVNQIIGIGEEQKSLDIHIRVPKRKPAIEQIIDVFVRRPHITHVEVLTGKVIVRGFFEAKTVYVACLPSQPVHAVEARRIRFTAEVPVCNARCGMDADASVFIEFIDYECDHHCRPYWHKQWERYYKKPKYQHDDCDDSHHHHEDDCDDDDYGHKPHKKHKYHDDCDCDCDQECHHHGGGKKKYHYDDDCDSDKKHYHDDDCDCGKKKHHYDDDCDCGNKHHHYDDDCNYGKKKHHYDDDCDYDHHHHDDCDCPPKKKPRKCCREFDLSIVLKVCVKVMSCREIMLYPQVPHLPHYPHFPTLPAKPKG